MTTPDDTDEVKAELERVYDGKAWVDVDAVMALLICQPEEPDDA